MGHYMRLFKSSVQWFEAFSYSGSTLSSARKIATHQNYICRPESSACRLQHYKVAPRWAGFCTGKSQYESMYPAVMFWVPIWVQVTYSHPGHCSEKIYIGESSGQKLCITIEAGCSALRSRSDPGVVLFRSWSGPDQVSFGSWSGPVQIPWKFLVSFLQGFMKPFDIVYIHVLFGIT